MGLFPVHGKNTYYERKRSKNGTDQHDEDQQQTEKGLTVYRPGGLRITIKELRKYKIAIAAIQETRWNKLTPHKPIRAMVITSIPGALPIIMNLEQHV
jgi:hypothetical protein